MFHLTLVRVKRQITNKGQMLRGKSALKTFSTPSPWQTPPTSCPVTTEHTQKRFEYKYRYKFGPKNSTKNAEIINFVGLKADSVTFLFLMY